MLQSFSISLNGFLQNKVNFWTNCKKEIFKFLLSLRWAKYACCKAAVEHGCHIWTGICTVYVLWVAVAKQISLISLSIYQLPFFCFKIIFGSRSIQYCILEAPFFCPRDFTLFVAIQYPHLTLYLFHIQVAQLQWSYENWNVQFGIANQLITLTGEHLKLNTISTNLFLSLINCPKQMFFLIFL